MLLMRRLGAGPQLVAFSKPLIACDAPPSGKLDRIELLTPLLLTSYPAMSNLRVKAALGKHPCRNADAGELHERQRNRHMRDSKQPAIIPILDTSKPETTLAQHSDDTQFVELPWKGSSISIEYRWIGLAQSGEPVIVFLHEGLGSISMWRDFPERFCNQYGFRGLVFSRYGYGRSTPRPREQDLPTTYLHEQAWDALPALLSALDIDRPWLFGHSDGGSISLLYAARFPHQVSGIIVMAPHIFVEDITIDGIRKAREAYLTTDLPSRLGRHHNNGDSVFWGWNNAWLDPAFRHWNIEAELGKITCPTLAIQGEGDEYGTLEQIYGIARSVQGAKAVPIANCGHSPHRDQGEMVEKVAAEFIRGS